MKLNRPDILHALKILLAQMLVHVLWYTAARSAQLQNAVRAALFDTAYGFLSLYTFSQVLSPDAPRIYLVAFLVGGAVGTVLGVEYVSNRF